MSWPQEDGDGTYFRHVVVLCVKLGRRTGSMRILLKRFKRRSKIKENCYISNAETNDTRVANFSQRCNCGSRSCVI